MNTAGVLLRRSVSTGVADENGVINCCAPERCYRLPVDGRVVHDGRVYTARRTTHECGPAAAAPRQSTHDGHNENNNRLRVGCFFRDYLISIGKISIKHISNA